MVFIFQIFRSLESPAEEDRARVLHGNVVEQRAYFIGNLTQLMNMNDLRNRDRVISMHLENYESVRMEMRRGVVCGEVMSKQIKTYILSRSIYLHFNNVLML